MSHWTKLTDRVGGGPLLVNLGRAFAVVSMEGGGSRIFSGDITATSLPRVKSTDLGYNSLPLSVDVREDLAVIEGLLRIGSFN